jgi:hypothetical protein
MIKKRGGRWKFVKNTTTLRRELKLETIHMSHFPVSFFSLL